MRSAFNITLQTVLLLLSLGTAAAEAFATFRSEDGGKSWQPSASGLPRLARVNGFEAIGGTTIAATDHGIFVSRDEGRTWQPVGNTNITAARPLCLISNRSVIFLGTQRAGVFASRDAGEHWVPVNGGPPAKTIRSLLAVDGVLFAGTDQEGVYRSNDGTNWVDFSEGLPAQPQVHQMANSGPTLFAALYNKGLYGRTIDGGPWRKTGEVTPLVITTVQGTLIVGHNPGGLRFSRDGGEQWTLVGTETHNSPFTLNRPDPRSARSKRPRLGPRGNTRLAFAGAADGIFFSPDEGRTWTRAVAGLPAESPGVAFLANDQFILATIVTKE